MPCSDEWNIAFSGCRFDFTLAFEFTLLSILPSLLFVLPAIWQISRLWTRSTVVNKNQTGYKVFLYTNVLIAAIATMSCILQVAAWTRRPELRRTIAITAWSFEAATSAAALILTGLEFDRSYRSTWLLSYYYFLQCIFDIARTRTFSLLHLPKHNMVFFAAFCITLGCRVAGFVAQSATRRRFLQAGLQKKVSVMMLPSIATNNAPQLPLEATASPLSQLTVSWITPLLLKGTRRQLEVGDLHDNVIDSADIYNQFERHWQSNLSRKAPLLQTLFRAYPWTMSSPALVAILGALNSCLAPLILRAILRYLDTSRPALPEVSPIVLRYLSLTFLKACGYGIIAMTAAQLLAAAFLKAHLDQATYKIAVVVRAALTQAVYRKSLKLHISAVEASTGAATSHIEIDVQRLAPFVFDDPGSDAN